MNKFTFILGLKVITLAALVLAWFWALPPALTPLLYLHPTDWTDADIVRDIWHFRLVQPEWVSAPPDYDYARWSLAETFARLGVVFLGWLASAALLILRYKGRNGTMRLAERLLGEVIVLLTAIALAFCIAHIVGPREFPDPGSQFSGEKRTQFYNRLVLGQIAFGISWVVFYYMLHKLYDRWRAGNAVQGSAGPENPPLDRPVTILWTMKRGRS